jgi:phosphoribosylanthranilate isomerase
MIKIKICGLQRKEDVEAVNRWLPDYTGFVFCESRRQVTPEQAGLLKAKLDSSIKAVGVFVNAPVSAVVKLCNQGIIDAVQLHGNEDEAYIQELKAQMDCPVIKAVRVQCADQVLQAEKLSCDFLLLDTYRQGQYGGSGEPFDHLLIPFLRKKFFLAGGLKKDNIAQAILNCKPYGVDVSSGVESGGVKAEDKIGQLIQTVRILEGYKGEGG